MVQTAYAYSTSAHAAVSDGIINWPLQ